ncbi:metal-dependent transcriptional regulator [bacterium]|nr:metal-dependent transcriptional regulator [bacterium]
MRNDSELTESQEDYLEAILNIIEEKGAVRAKDIAERLDVKSPSVTGALRALRARELVNYEPYDVITLTPVGRRRAREVIRRHEVLKRLFIRSLGAGIREADRAACRMEHGLPARLVGRLERFLDLVEGCPEGDEAWLCGVGRALTRMKNADDCKACINSCIAQYTGVADACDD